MQNDLIKIIQKVHDLAHQLFPVEDVEMEILYSISTELLSEMGEIEQYDNVKKALINMFQAGYLLGKNKINKEEKSLETEETQDTIAECGRS